MGTSNCGASKLKVICNLLDILFIHDDIHGRPCKKYSRIMHSLFLSTSSYNGYDKHKLRPCIIISFTEVDTGSIFSIYTDCPIA